MANCGINPLLIINKNSFSVAIWLFLFVMTFGDALLSKFMYNAVKLC